jgi:hypothetical protein
MSKNCQDCKFCVLEDYGYSNYTVEGTLVHCGKNIHPDSPFDRFYGKELRLEFANKCHGFEAGNAIEIDVDRECLPLTEEELKICEAVGIEYLRR